MLSPRSPAGRTQRREEQGCVLKRAGRGRNSPCRRGGDTDTAPLSPSLPPSLSGLGPGGSIRSPRPAQAGLAERPRFRAGRAGRARCPRSLRGARQDRGRRGGRSRPCSRVTPRPLPCPALHYSTHQAAAPPGPPPAGPAHDWLFPAGGGRSSPSTGPRSCPSARGVEGRWQHGRGCGGVRRRRWQDGARRRCGPRLPPPARSSPAVLSSARPGAARPGAAGPGAVRPCWALPGSARSSPTVPSSARSSPAVQSSARPSPEQPGRAEPGPARPEVRQQPRGAARCGRCPGAGRPLTGGAVRPRPAPVPERRAGLAGPQRDRLLLAAVLGLAVPSSFLLRFPRPPFCFLIFF